MLLSARKVSKCHGWATPCSRPNASPPPITAHLGKRYQGLAWIERAVNHNNLIKISIQQCINIGRLAEHVGNDFERSSIIVGCSTPMMSLRTPRLRNPRYYSRCWRRRENMSTTACEQQAFVYRGHLKSDAWLVVVGHPSGACNWHKNVWSNGQLTFDPYFACPFSLLVCHK